ncbi:MAG: alpha-2-macroglobulin family protein, partial [bacterium]
LAGLEYGITVSAKHLFGAPAVDRKCEASVHFQRGGFSPDNWKEYRFDNDSKYVPESISLGEAKTNEQGIADFTFTYTPNADVTFPLTATVVGRVFELGGRAVAASKSAILSPSETILGITASNPPTGGIEVHAAAIHPDETPALLDKVSITLERQVWDYYVRRYYSNNQPSWTESFETVETREVDLQEGRGSTQFKIDDYGYYRVRVHSDQTPQYSTISFYSYADRCELVDAARPSLIKISTDKTGYEVGDEAVVRIESPFDGWGIVVLQSNTIKKMMSVEIRDNAGVVTIPLTDAEYPNIWVEATVIHAVQKGKTQLYPFSSFAMTNLCVNNPKRTIQIAIPDLPEEIRPATATQFSIEVCDSQGQPIRAELTLAAVDEGIHAITNYQTPDPYGYISRPRRPDFRRAHYYDRVAYDFDTVEPGGGAEGELAKRATSGLENWIKPVAIWSGAVITDSSGHADITMNIPEFTGQLRLVAVACNENAVGAYDAQLLVRRLYMLGTSMPRFMLPQDSAQCRAVVFNNSEQPCQAKGRWITGGTLQPATGEITLNIPAKSEKDFSANIIAGDLAGQGEICWEMTIFDSSGQKLEILKEIAPLPVNPPAVFQSHHEIRIATPGQTIEIRNDRFLDDARAEIEVVIGANPALELGDALKYLVGYPYGCIEQTNSRLMPLYLLRRNSTLMDSVLKDKQALRSYLQTGIDRLFAMQTNSGGLGFWPGAREAYPYGSVYAFHFLTLVRNDRELEIPMENYESLKNYVRGLIADWSDESQSSFYQRAYALYVLALSGDLQAIQQIPRFDEIVLPMAGRFLLAAALAHSTKDSERVSLYLSKTPSAPYLVLEPDKTLNSDIRNTAVELLALRHIGGDPAVMAQKANKLTIFLRNSRHGTTQETAFIISALGLYLEDITGNIDRAAAQIEYSSTGERQGISGAEVYRNLHMGPKGTFIVTNTGEADLIVNITTRGIPKTIETISPIREGVEIDRRFYSEKGIRVKSMEFQSGENYIVEVELSCEQNAKNLIVADLLPGGFEVENPRLDPSAVPEGKFKGGASPSYLDIRDDRVIVAFDELDQGLHRFYYVVRAVTPGTYYYPPVETECMYNPSVHGASAHNSIKVF